MRIAFLSTLSRTYASFMGRAFAVARSLIKAGHRVQILTLHHDWSGRTFDELAYGQVPIRYVGPMHVRGLGDERRQLSRGELLRAAALATVRLTHHALATSADLYHVWKPHPFNGIAGVIAARLRRRPLLLDCDDYEAMSTRFTGDWQQGVVRWFEDTLPRLADGVTANTRFWTERLQNTLKISSDRVVYIPNGVEEERFGDPDVARGQKLRRELGLVNKKVVVYVGILSLAGHPLDLLLESFTHVAEALPQAHLVLVGGGEDGVMLRQRVVEMGLAHRVTFTGVVPPEEVTAYYLLGDCSVDPVRDDVHARARCPLKVLESMACGVPVVTGEVGDRYEILRAGKAGLLVQPGNKAALAAGIQSLLSDPVRRMHIGQEARLQAQRYRWDLLTQELLSFYRQIHGKAGTCRKGQ
jgi:glycosyltransferase involved in cell wall biosynthesis